MSELLERSRRAMPGGVSSPVRAFASVPGDPPLIARAKGAEVFDTEGKRYVDLVGSWGPLILGHAHPAVVALAALAVAWKYWDYVVNPWTRDGQVRAEVIQVTPRVSGPIVELPVEDNQFVNAGDLLFQIDPRTFEANLAQARAQYDSTRDNYVALEKKVEAALAPELEAVLVDFERSGVAAERVHDDMAERFPEMSAAGLETMRRMAGVERQWMTGALDSFGGVAGLPAWLESIGVSADEQSAIRGRFLE